MLTALGLEFTAAVGPLSGRAKVASTVGTIYETGHFEGWAVAVAEVGQGNTTAAVEVERAISVFGPDCLMFLGIAGGLKDVALGDVVAATKVYGYESGKQDRAFLPRPSVGQVSHRLEQAARAVIRDGVWRQRFELVAPASPAAHAGPIAAGEKVVASRRSGLYRFLRKHYSDALAVEMEGRGFLAGAFAHKECDAIVIRGISDLIEGKTTADEKGWQQRAAAHAAAFAYDLLSLLNTLEDPRYWTLTVEDIFDDEIVRLIELIRKTAQNPRISLKKTTRGSVTLHLESSNDAYERILEAWRSGELEPALGVKILRIAKGSHEVSAGSR